MLLRILNLSVSLSQTRRITEGKAFLREQIPKARRALGAEDDTVMRLRGTYASMICMDHESSRDELVEAAAIFGELHSRTRRVYGPQHPLTARAQKAAEDARGLLALGYTARSR